MLAFLLGLGVTVLLWIIVSWLMVAICTGVAAANKGRSGPGWFFLGLLFGPAALVLALVVRNLNPEPMPVYIVRYREDGSYYPDPDVRDVRVLPDPGEYKICPHCAEYVKKQAVVCRYCGRDLQSAPQAGSSSPADGSGDSDSDPAPAPSVRTVVRGLEPVEPGPVTLTAGAQASATAVPAAVPAAPPAPPPPVAVVPAGEPKKNNMRLIAVIGGIFAAVVVLLVVLSKTKKEGPPVTDERPAAVASQGMRDQVSDLRTMSEEAKRALAEQVMTDRYGRPMGDAWEVSEGGDLYEMRVARVETVDVDGQPTLQILAKGDMVRGQKTDAGGLVSVFAVVPSAENGYTVVLEKTNYRIGMNGKVPKRIARMEVGRGILAWHFEMVVNENGRSSKHHSVLIPHRGMVVKSSFPVAKGWDLDTPFKKNVSAIYYFDKKAPGRYYPMKFVVRGYLNGKEVQKKIVTVPFDDASGTYSPPDPLEVINEAMVNDPVQALGELLKATGPLPGIPARR